MSKTTTGRLLYVIGPSGAGKDSVLRMARNQAPNHLWFAHRYITRPADDPSENHVALTPVEFAKRKDMGAFCLDWACHGWLYGIGSEIDLWLQAGNHVVVNGSRAAMTQALERFPQMIPVQITADENRLRERLFARGRENEDAINERLKRNRELTLDHSGLVTILNNDSVEQAAEKFLAVIPSART